MRNINKLIFKKYVLLVFAMICSIVLVITEIEVINLLQNLISFPVDNKKIIYYVILIIGIAICGTIAKYCSTFFCGKFEAEIVAILRREIVNSIFRNLSFNDQFDRSDLLAKATSDLENVKNFLSNYFKDIIYIPIMIIFFSIYLSYLHKKLFIYSILPLIFLITISIMVMKPIKRRSREYVKMLADTNLDIVQLYEGILTIKAYQLEKKIVEKYSEKLKKALNFSIKNDNIQYCAEPITYIIMYLPLVLCLFWGSRFIINEGMNIGILVAYISLLKIFINPLVRAYQLYVNFKLAIASIERIESVLSCNIYSIYTNKRIADYNVCIYKFCDYSFGYQDGNMILKRINLEINKNDKITIIGKSGCGKSTLLNLLWLKFGEAHTASSGNFEIFGYDSSELSTTDIRDEIAIISQSSFMFNLSIADNIKVGNKDATLEQIVKVCKQVGCHNFIMNLPQQYDTILGENGVGLSGGEIQRIAIARALIKESNIIILDEPTSALDDVNERIIMKVINETLYDKTLIMVTHRIQAILNNSTVYILQNGALNRWTGDIDEKIFEHI